MSPSTSLGRRGAITAVSPTSLGGELLPRCLLPLLDGGELLPRGLLPLLEGSYYRGVSYLSWRGAITAVSPTSMEGSYYRGVSYLYGGELLPVKVF